MPFLRIHLPDPLARLHIGELTLREYWMRFARFMELDPTFDDTQPAAFHVDGSWLPSHYPPANSARWVAHTTDGPRIIGSANADELGQSATEEATLSAHPVTARTLWELEQSSTENRLQRNLDAGVFFHGRPAWIGPDVVLAPGCRIGPGVWLSGSTHVEAGATVAQGSHLHNTQVQAGAQLAPYTVAEDAVIGPESVVGPFARLREGTTLHRGAKVGNFVETKKTTLGEGAKANHLTYLGNATIGPRTNIGAGTITCNYDGANKHPTTIGADTFIGTQSALVAPLTVGDRALVSAGAVVTDDVPDEALVIARSPQKTLPGKGARILARNKARKAAKKAST